MGTYSIAMALARAPAEKIRSLFMRTAAPLVGNVMEVLPSVRRYYLIIVELLSTAVMPLMVGLAIVAPQAVVVIYKQKWIAASRPVQWLALFMIMRVLGVLAEQVLVSQRLTRLTMRMSILSFAVMPLAFFLGARWNGPSGVAAAWILLSPLTIVPLLIVLLRSIKLQFREYASALFPAVAGSIAMWVAVYALSRWHTLRNVAAGSAPGSPGRGWRSRLCRGHYGLLPRQSSALHQFPLKSQKAKDLNHAQVSDENRSQSSASSPDRAASPI